MLLILVIQLHVKHQIEEKLTTYLHSFFLEDGLPKLLNVLCKGGDVTSNLEKNQGLAKLFADVLDFVFEFDHLKVR
jgi:hypothetical protein